MKMNSNEEKGIISNKINIDRNVVADFKMDAINNFIEKGRKVSHKLEGINYIVDVFSNSGIVPKGLTFRMNDSKLVIDYIDANSVVQTVEGESIDYLVEEMVETTLANGYPLEWLFVYLNEKSGGNAPTIEGVNSNNVNRAIEEAYNLKESMNNNLGVSR